MDLTKKGLREFRTLMKESEKSWETNQIRFNEGVVKPEKVPPSNKIQIPDDDQSTKEKRKCQIDLGHMILGYFKEEPSKEKKAELERVGPGRPRKEREEKVRVISLKIRPEYVEFLKGLSFGRGIGSRIRIIIDDWSRFKKREKEQVGVLRKALGELDGALKRYARNYDRSENFEKNEETLRELEKACGNIKILMNLLKFEIGELEKLLSKEEIRNLEFAYSWSVK